jgi:3D (Asp-Asp-Asp) domain-containing protein
MGTKSRPGVVAADPTVLPLGSRIRIAGAGKYSGEYSVEDTGGKVAGRMLDLYVKTKREARRFGRRKVRVTVLRLGPEAS